MTKVFGVETNKTNGKVSFVKNLVSLIAISLVLAACSQTPDEDIFSVECPSSEDLSGNTGTISLDVGDKLNQSLTMSGIVGASVYVSAITIHMDTSNLTDVTLSVYDNVLVPGLFNPEGGQLLGTSTVTSGLGDPDATTPITFDFDAAFSFTVGETYQLVLTATGGAFEVSYVAPQLIASGSVTVNDGGGWSTSAVGTNANISLIMDYSHCTGI